MPITKNRNNIHNANRSLETKGILMKVKLNPSVGLYELHENDATYGVGLDMLNNIKNYFQSYLGNKYNSFPTLLLWYKGLTCDEKKTVMIIGSERTENDR